MVKDAVDLRYWITVGFKLGRLEFLWGSTYKEAQQAFEESKQELIQMIDKEVPIDESSFRAFCNNILFYYMRHNEDYYSSILIGICLQRCALVGADSNESKNKELKDLAMSALNGIPNTFITDKDLLFTIIWNNRKKDDSIYSVAQDVFKAFFSSPNTQKVIKGPLDSTDNYVFISYSSKDSVIASKLRDLLEANKVKSWIAPDSIPVGSDYTEVIVDAIEGSSGVVLLLTENAQSSKWIPKELDIAITSDKVIFPIHLDSSEIIKSLRFRLTNSQMIEARGDVSSVFATLLTSIKKHMV